MTGCSLYGCTSLGRVGTPIPGWNKSRFVRKVWLMNRPKHWYWLIIQEKENNDTIFVYKSTVYE